jgi:hypothetical protein
MATVSMSEHVAKCSKDWVQYMEEDKSSDISITAIKNFSGEKGIFPNFRTLSQKTAHDSFADPANIFLSLSTQSSA